MKRRLIISTAISGISLALSAYPAFAQASAPNEGDASQAGLGDIVVTAQKRNESINSVGMSITAASATDIQQKAIVSVADLTRIEPSLQYAEAQYGTPIYTIRGVGYYEQSLAASPTISIYQDEVAFPFPVMSKGVLLDPERVEILKGPQGTLYGQNATGGAINFIAAKPTKNFTAGFDLSYGRFGATLLSGFVSGSLSPTLSFRLAGSAEEGGAWQRSVTRNDRLGDKRTRLGRLILNWEPSDQFKASLNLNGFVDRSDTQAGQLTGVRFSSPQFISPNALTPAALNFLPQAAYFATYPAAIQAVVNQPLGTANARSADWYPGTRPDRDERFYQAALRLDYSISDMIGMSSLTSYQHFKEHNIQDGGGVAVPNYTITIDGKVKSFSQELRIHGDMAGDKLHWLAGVNYARDRSSERDVLDPYGTSASFLTGGSQFSALPLVPFNFGAQNAVTAKTYAAFANADLKLLNTVTVHGGIRYTESKQDLANCSFGSAPATLFFNGLAQQLAGLFGGTAPTPVAPFQCLTLGPAPNFQPGLNRTSLNQNNVSWRLGVDWTPIERTLLYVNVSKGYKAGSSPSLGATTSFQLKPINQESVISYEAGFKATLFERMLQLNGAYFHYDYTDKQFLGRVQDPLHIFGAVQTLVNIPKSKVDGFELSALLRPMPGLTLSGAVTYLDSRVTSDFLNYSTYVIGDADTVNFKGEAFPFTPKWSLQYGARYDWSLNERLSAFVSADGSYQTKTVASFAAAHAATEGPPVDIPSYSLLNLTAGVETADERWRFELWGKNVLNKYYWHNVIWSSDTTIRLAGAPATYGIRLHYRFQ